MPDLATPLVSVVMPAHQAEAHLGEAIRTALDQDWEALELIVVDDGSTDATRAIAEAARARAGGRMRVLAGPRGGAGAARDRGIAEARGDLILLADADDRCDPDHVTALVRALLADPGADLAFARCRYVDQAGRVDTVQGQVPPRPGARDLLAGLMVNTPLVRRSALEAVGGHDRSLRGSIDLDLLVRLAMRREGALLALDRVSSDYRRAPGQITSDWRRMEGSWRRVLEKARGAGLELGPSEVSRMRGRNCVFWSGIAYKAGEFADARRLIAEALRRAPLHVLRDPQARIRAAACAASLLPRPLHERIRTRFNARGRTA